MIKSPCEVVAKDVSTRLLFWHFLFPRYAVPEYGDIKKNSTREGFANIDDGMCSANGNDEFTRIIVCKQGNVYHRDE